MVLSEMLGDMVMDARDPEYAFQGHADQRKMEPGVVYRTRPEARKGPMEKQRPCLAGDWEKRPSLRRDIKAKIQSEAEQEEEF